VRLSPALDVSFPGGDVELIDLVTALLDDFAPAAIHETGPDKAPDWRVFFPGAAMRDEAVAALTRAFPSDRLTISAIDVPDEDWAARSQAGLRAVRVARIVVAPPWDVPQRGGDDVVVVIQPSMGFGTGHHETTRLCLSLLQEIDCLGRRVLDVGTGSGVLALAAAALGAIAVEGIDLDPDAVTNAEENLALNPSLTGAAAIGFSVGDLRGASSDGAPAERVREDDRRSGGAGHAIGSPGAGTADIVLANLTGALLATAAADLLARASPGGALILSGFQHHEAAAVLAPFAGAADLITQRSEADWQAALLRLP
jgi:ribosomal protein L11 methyltransferase